MGSEQPSPGSDDEQQVSETDNPPDSPAGHPSEADSLPDRFRTDLRLAWEEHRRYVGFSALLFLVGMPVGVLLSLQGFDLAAALGLDDIEELFPEDAELTATFILTNNTRVFLLLVVGAVTAGLLTFFTLALNGFIVGYVITPIVAEEGIAFVLLGLLPHGVPELLAFFVAGGVAFRTVVGVFEKLRGNRDVIYGREGWRQVGVFLAVAWVILAVAAVIEAYVTVAILETLG